MSMNPEQNQPDQPPIISQPQPVQPQPQPMVLPPQIVEKKPTPVVSVLALVAAIVGLVMTLIVLKGGIFSAIGFILGAIAIKKKFGGFKLAVAAVVLSVLAFIMLLAASSL